MIHRYGELELIQLTDRDGSLGHIDTTVLSAVIMDATAEIDGYLRDGGYRLPLSEVPQTLVRHACQLARYYLYDGIRPEPVREDWQESQRWLEKLAQGKIKLADSRAESTGAIAAGSRTMIYDGPTMSRYAP